MADVEAMAEAETEKFAVAVAEAVLSSMEACPESHPQKCSC